MFNSDKAAAASGRLWLKLARTLDKLALEKAAGGYIDKAIKAARCADACYWQATGEGDAITLKEISDESCE